MKELTPEIARDPFLLAVWHARQVLQEQQPPLDTVSMRDYAGVLEARLATLQSALFNIVIALETLPPPRRTLAAAEKAITPAQAYRGSHTGRRFR
jgi:hypothetical protein